MSCLWIPVLNKISKQGKEKFKEVIDFEFFKKLIKSLLDPTQGFVYQWLKKRVDTNENDRPAVEVERPIIEVYRMLALCTLNHDLNQLDDYHKNILIDFYWKMIKIRYNFKQWSIYAISEFFKNLDLKDDKVNDVYYHILESNINENGRGRMLQNIAIDNIINLVNINEVATMKNAVNFLRQEDNSMFHIADILIKYESKFFPQVVNFYNEIRNILLKLLSSSYTASSEKKKLALYLCEVCIKWLQRIIRDHSLPESTPMNRQIDEEYKKPFYRIQDAISICLQKELDYIIRYTNNTQNPYEVMMKYLILLKQYHEINPLFVVETKLGLDLTIGSDDTKEKSKFKSIFILHHF